MPYSETLQTLMKDPRWVSGELQPALQALTEAACAALNVDRVSIWQMENGDGIRSLDLYDRRQAMHADGAYLAVAQAPAYFEAIAEQRMVCIVDAQNDPRTAPFRDGYLLPENIGAMLDAQVQIDGHVGGVVCHEHVGSTRQWDEHEQTFAATIGDLASLAMQSARRREAEQRLLQREAEVRLAMEAARVADWSWDVPTDEVRWSPGVAQMFGRPEGWTPGGVAGFLSQIPEDDRERVANVVQQAVASGDDYYVEHQILRPDGGVGWLEGRGRVLRGPDGEAVRVAGIVADVTRRHELEERLRRSERLEALGRLAGGVAHDFNNLLTAIGGSAQLLVENPNGPHRDQLLGLIVGSADRAAELTQQLLAFGRRQPSASGTVDLGRVTRDLARLLDRLLGEHIELTVSAEEGCWVRAEASQLEQVALNLALNGRDAMPGGGQLAITVELRNDDVCLRVRDTGSGIDPALRSRIFEPYFTTKALGRGTGLGLALCHGVVEQLGGTIDVDSALGEGSTFVVSLPRAEAEPTDASAAPETARPNPSGVTVLLVEDEPAVAALLIRVLERAGYSVSHADNGSAALQTLERSRPDLLVCDVVLPGLSGPEVVQAARRLHGPLPVLLITGYAPEDLPADLLDVPLMTKPFRPADLVAKVGELARTP